MKRHFPVLLLLGCVAVFVLGVMQLFKLRFEAGDVYPKYSSLRADPLGTMALYESLGKIHGITVRRDYSATGRLPEGRDIAYLHLAASTYDWRRVPEETFRDLQRFLAAGGRLVIAFKAQPATWSRSSARENDEADPEPNRGKKPGDGESKGATKDDPKSPGEKKMKHDREEEEPGFRLISLQERWGVDFVTVNLEQGDNDAYEPARVLNKTELLLPQALDWHSGIIFTNLDKAWRGIYLRGTNPVVIEREIGRGAVVMATDSYYFSNEAMQKDRHADLVAWLIGSGKTVVFDEAHLGVAETSGVAALMHKYRLQGLVAGLVLLAGLFIWKNSTSLVPLPAEEKQADHVAGKDSAAGFVNLLRRSIAPRDLLNTCYDEWKRTAALSGKYSAAKLRHADAVFQSEQAIAREGRDPIKTYQALAAILKRSEFGVPTVGEKQALDQQDKP